MIADSTTPQDPTDSHSIHARFECACGRIHDLALSWEAGLDKRLWPDKPEVVYVEDDPGCDCLLPDDVVEQIRHELGTQYPAVLERGYVLIR